MYRHACKAVLFILLAVSTAGSIFAQQHVGAEFSPSRSGLLYGREVSGDVFWDASVSVDYAGAVLKQSRQAGVNAMFNYNFRIARRTHSEGSSFLYIGPGVTLGYLRDRDKSYGLLAGVTASFGYEYRFAVPISISVGIVPVVGLHMGRGDEENMILSIYKNGLLWAFAPQFSLKYHIGSGKASSPASSPASSSSSSQASSPASSRSGSRSDETSGGALADASETLCAGESDDGKPSRRSSPRFTFGAEWGYSATISHAYHHNYTSPYGRVDSRGNFINFLGNGYVSLHAGVNLGRHLNLSVFGGYEGIYRGQTVWPVSLRGTWLFGKDVQKWFTFLDGGLALSSAGFDPGAAGKIGAGYRIPLSRSVKLDLMVSCRFIYSGIELYDEYNETVSPDRIRRNDNYFSSINFSMGITL